ncbi:MAG TPA: hypothetical protein VHD56_16070 [Tepidisphaeraceae bacterium]|nr:hypothetical protein [Tepidisphaeraceae bacterium]
MRTFKCGSFAVVFFTLIAAGPLTLESPIDDVLDALDARGQGLNSFVADVKLTETDTALGDSNAHMGKVLYKAGDAPQIRVTFDKKQSNDKPPVEDKVEYKLAGPELIERNYRTSTQTTRHVLKPGQKLNLLKLGEGPFPLPIGQKKEDVHNNFDVKKIDIKKEDPAGTVHLQLTPKEGTQFASKFKSIDVWVDLKDNMPRKIETLDPNATATRTTELSNVQVNPQLKDEDFALPPIDEKTWQLHEEAFQR